MVSDAAAHNVPPWMVVDPQWRPCRSFELLSEALDWARTREAYLGAYLVVDRDDKRIRYSWREPRGPFNRPPGQ